MFHELNFGHNKRFYYNIHTYNLDVKNDFLPTNMILKKYACLVCQIIHLKSNKFIFKIILLLKFVYPFVIHIKSKLINISNWKHGTNDKHCVKSGVNKGLSRVDRILGRKTTSHICTKPCGQILFENSIAWCCLTWRSF